MIMKNTPFIFTNSFVLNRSIKTKLRERKDHFVVTLYKAEREAINALLGDLIIFTIKGHELIRPIRKDFHISLPKKLLQTEHHLDNINLIIQAVVKRENCLFRSEKPFLGNQLNINHFIPKVTRHGYPLYFIKRDDDYSTIWFPIGGGVNHVTIKNQVPIEKIAELLGFYFGDGSTSHGIQSFRITNCEPSNLKYSLEILELIGIKRDCCKVQVIYSTDKEIDSSIKERCTVFWSKALGIDKNKIVSVLPSRNVRETKFYGSARVFIDSSVLVEILLNGLLNGVVQRISNPSEENDYLLLKGFMRGLLAAEGGVTLNKNGTVVKVGISYDPPSYELDFYKKILSNLGIGYGKTKGNELYIYNHCNLLKLREIDAFRLHTARNAKFLSGFKS